MKIVRSAYCHLNGAMWHWWNRFSLRSADVYLEFKKINGMFLVRYSKAGVCFDLRSSWWGATVRRNWYSWLNRSAKTCSDAFSLCRHRERYRFPSCVCLSSLARSYQQLSSDAHRTAFIMQLVDKLTTSVAASIVPPSVWEGRTNSRWKSPAPP